YAATRGNGMHSLLGVSSSPIVACILTFIMEPPMSLAVLILAALTVTPAATSTNGMHHDENYYLPSESASTVVAVTPKGSAAAGFTILTQAVAIKETGPKETVSRFGEVYSFSPSFMVVHRDEPTAVSFWNLQPDDDHDFMLVDPDLNVLMKVKL